MNFIINRKHCVNFASYALMNLIMNCQNVTTTLFLPNMVLLSLAIWISPYTLFTCPLATFSGSICPWGMHEHNLPTGWIQVKHQHGIKQNNMLKLIVHRVCMSTTYRLVESKSNINIKTKIIYHMLKTHSTQGMHEHNLPTGWIQVKHQHGIKQNNMFKLIVHRVCMSTTYSLVESKSNINMVCIFETK